MGTFLPIRGVNIWGHFVLGTGSTPLREFDFIISELNTTNSTNLYSPTKGSLRETCNLKSQNINPIYLTLSSSSVSFIS